MRHKTSIIILSYNTLELLRLCVNSIREYTEVGTYEIIVVENASKDGSAEWLREQMDLRCIYNEENRGFPGGCNQGLTAATGRDLLLLNSDTVVTKDWLKNLRLALYSSARVGRRELCHELLLQQPADRGALRALGRYAGICSTPQRAESRPLAKEDDARGLLLSVQARGVREGRLPR